MVNIVDARAVAKAVPAVKGFYESAHTHFNVYTRSDQSWFERLYKQLD